MKKGDVGMAKRFSKVRKQGMSFNYLQSYVKMPVSAWFYIPTPSLPPEPSSIIQALDTKGPVVSIGEGNFLGICHLLSIQLV